MLRERGEGVDFHMSLTGPFFLLEEKKGRHAKFQQIVSDLKNHVKICTVYTLLA